MADSSLIPRSKKNDPLFHSLLQAASIWRPSPPAMNVQGVITVYFSSSGSRADDRAFPDAVNVHRETLDLVVQRLLWDAQKGRGRLNIAQLATQCVLDDRSLDVFQLSRQRQVRRPNARLVDRLAVEDTKHETISDVAKFTYISRP